MRYKFIGWCKEGIHDKVWGIILLAEDVQVSPAWPFKTNKYVTFWGRRGAKLQTKIWSGKEDQADELFDMKLRKGYKQINKNELDDESMGKFFNEVKSKNIDRKTISIKLRLHNWNTRKLEINRRRGRLLLQPALPSYPESPAAIRKAFSLWQSAACSCHQKFSLAGPAGACA